MSTFEVIHGVEGYCLALDDTRIAGPKPWGGGTVTQSWETDEDYKAVVHCRDCEKYHPELYKNINCEKFMFDVEPDGFCAWGEQRKEDEMKGKVEIEISCAYEGCRWMWVVWLDGEFYKSGIEDTAKDAMDAALNAYETTTNTN